MMVINIYISEYQTYDAKIVLNTNSHVQRPLSWVCFSERREPSINWWRHVRIRAGTDHADAWEVQGSWRAGNLCALS